MAKTRKLTPAQKLHHVAYDAAMFVFLIKLGAPHEAVRIGRHVVSEQVLTNILVEQRAIHARNVIEFLRNVNEIHADQFIGNYKPDKTTRKALKQLAKRASTEVLHMTSLRIADITGPIGPAGSKQWILSDFSPLLDEIKKLADALLGQPDIKGLLNAPDLEAFEYLANELPLKVMPFSQATAYTDGLKLS